MKNVDLKVLALGIVGVVLILLAVGSIMKAASTGEGLDPAIASAAFALLGAMVAGALGNQVVSKDKKEENVIEVNDFEPGSDD
ncbi:hypothetical protein OAV62_02325 [bacterium]|nr:hypothetical protein [bacterium]